MIIGFAIRNRIASFVDKVTCNIEHVKMATTEPSKTYLLLVFRRKNHVHRDNVVEKVAETEDEIVVEDVVAVGEVVADVALARHRHPRHASQKGKRTARQLVSNIQDSIRLDVKFLAKLFSREAVLQKVADSTKYEREEDDAEDEFDCPGEKTGLVHSWIEQHVETVSRLSS